MAFKSDLYSASHFSYRFPHIRNSIAGSAYAPDQRDAPAGAVETGRALANVVRVQRNRKRLNEVAGRPRPNQLAAQRIGALPENELPKIFGKWCECGELQHYARSRF
jgi:hypothetical protein